MLTPFGNDHIYCRSNSQNVRFIQQLTVATRTHSVWMSNQSHKLFYSILALAMNITCNRDMTKVNVKDVDKTGNYHSERGTAFIQTEAFQSHTDHTIFWEKYFGPLILEASRKILFSMTYLLSNKHNQFGSSIKVSSVQTGKNRTNSLNVDLRQPECTWAWGTHRISTHATGRSAISHTHVHI